MELLGIRPRRGLAACAALAALVCVTAPGGAEARRPDVVMIVFDEFPSVSLLDGHGRVDRVRYPAFASLAAGGDWFPNATASVDETGRAVEALLTGSTPERRHPVTFEANPRNLFTLLGGRYRVVASQEVTAMCPLRLCPHAGLPTRTEVLHELAGGRPERFASWVRSIRRSRPPTFYFKHVLLPHVPLRYLPSGRKYASGPHEQIRGIVQDFHQRWLIAQAYQRHLLQLGFTDRLLGSALRRLRKIRRYDRSLIVVTADNGESFGRVGDRHVINRGNAADIALTPLFIKRPGQRRGRIVRRHVRMVDVVPSVAHVLRLVLPWRTNGQSVFGAPARRIPSGVTLTQRSGRHLHLSFASLRRRARQALRTKLRLFGSGPWEPGLYRIGPFRVLHGKPARLFHIRRSRRVRAIVHPGAKLRSVGSRPGFLPSYITGKIVGGRPRRSRNLALSVNGVIAATFPSFHLRGSRSELYSVLVPESALRPGRNRVRLFAIGTRRGRIGLVALR